MMLQGMTAQYLLRQIYKVGPGDVVLVQAAAGGMGVFLCQWAAALGATVLGTVSTEEKAAFARANGCHHPILYTRVNVPEEVKKITHGAMATVAYDAVGNPDQAIGRDHASLAVAAGNRRIGNAVACPELGDLGANRLDHAGALVAWNERQAERKPPGTLHDLDIVQANRGVAQPHFVRPDIANLDLFPAQYFRAAKLMNANCVGHVFSFSEGSLEALARCAGVALSVH